MSMWRRDARSPVRRSAAAVHAGIPGLCALLLLIGAAPATAQVATIAGTVIDAAGGAALGSAIVAVEGTPLRATTDSRGAYRLARVPAGPRVLRVTRLGYSPLRHSVVVPPQGALTLNLTLARNALQLPGLNVVEDPAGRARGELGTASVIGADAIRNQTAASLAGILELVPGTLLQPPGLDGVQQFALRAVPVGPGAASATIGTSASALASFGTQIVLDGVPASNNVNLQTLGARGELSFASSAGGGIDLRRIPAATLERVEVIRGIPSSRFGDLTQGVVVVETRAGAVDPEARIRADARTVEATLIGGRSVASLGAATAHLNVARTAIAPGLINNVGSRISSQLAHRHEGDRLTLDTRVDWFQVLHDRPPTKAAPDVSARTRDNGFRLSERLRWRPRGEMRLEWTAAFEGLRQRSFAQSPKVRGAMPFTSRLTEGTQDGKFIGGTYVARVDVEGDPRHLYQRLEASRPARALGFDHEVRAGLELRREWNAGPGYLFDIEFPPQVEFNGVNGFDRPRRFDRVPPIVTSALYLDDRAMRALGRGWSFGTQVGVRLDQLHRGGTWFSAARDRVVQPRVQLELAPTPRLRVRAGAGLLAKVPTLSDLFPDRQYYDLVNFNWYANDPNERRAILTTRILERENPALRMTRAGKAEAGMEIDVGRGGLLALVAYADRARGAPGLRLDPTFLIRDRYAFDSATINQGQPPDVIEPPIASDTMPVIVDRPDNNVDLASRGWELTAVFPEIEPLRTRVALQAAWSRSRLAAEGVDFGTDFEDFQLNENRLRSPYWENVVQRGERLLITTRVIHHQPIVGLVITGTTQLFIREVRVNEGGVDTLGFAGYINRRGDLVPVPLSERTEPQFGDLRVSRLGVLLDPQRGPVDWLFSVQVSKALPRDGRLSFYAFNAFDRLGSFGGRTTTPRTFAAARFGLEVTVPLGLDWGHR